jgi:dTDP-L-rhamnose 4-epimerase
VLHLAAKVGLGVDVQDLPDYASSNDAGTAELLAAMARAGVKHLTLASSMVVYGEGLGHCPSTARSRPRRAAKPRSRPGSSSRPARIAASRSRPLWSSEDTPLDPRNAYASSKVAQEFYATNWARLTGGSVAAMRYHNVYGPGMPRDTPYAGVAAIFTSALKRGEAPKVFEDGRQRRDFVHVRDVAAATVLACERHRRRRARLQCRLRHAAHGRRHGARARAALSGPEPLVTGTIPARRRAPHHGGFPRACARN